jgi:hypothetical protein
MMSGFLVDPDAQKLKRVMESMMQMQKLDIAKLQAAYDEASGAAAGPPPCLIAAQSG